MLMRDVSNINEIVCDYIEFDFVLFYDIMLFSYVIIECTLMRLYFHI